MIGHVSSIETMGLVDGPGVRFVVFLSGCNLRCIYCHNPETWIKNNGNQRTSEDLIEQIIKYKNYYQKGGVTFSGGEPLLQNEFLLEMLKLCKEHGLHTAIDTAGVGNGNYEEILKHTDLVLLDIKGITEEQYETMAGIKLNEFNNFVKSLNKSNKPVWIRHVIVPGYNDNKEHILKFKEYIKQVNNVEKIELLPYKSLGKDKYQKLNLPCKLDNTEDLSKGRIKELESYLK